MRRTAMTIVEMMIAFLIIIIALSMVLLLPGFFLNIKNESYMTKELYNTGISFAEELISLPPEATELKTGVLHTREATLQDEVLTINWQLLETSKDFTTFLSSDTTTVSSVTHFSFNYASITVVDKSNDYSYHLSVIPKQAQPEDD